MSTDKDRERIAEAIKCKELCIHYSQCKPFTNPVGCNRIELRQNVVDAIEQAGYTSRPEPARELVERVAEKIYDVAMLADNLENDTEVHAWQEFKKAGGNVEFWLSQAKSIIPLIEQEVRGKTYQNEKYDRLTYLDEKTELTKDGRPKVDEVVLSNASVHLESLSDQCFMLIVENAKHHWHLSICSDSHRGKIHAIVQEQEDK